MFFICAIALANQGCLISMVMNTMFVPRINILNDKVFYYLLYILNEN